MSRGAKWTWEETLAAFALYLTVPIKEFDKKDNKDVAALAHALGRSHGSVHKKLNNLLSRDPFRPGHNGLKNCSKLDKQIWMDFKEEGSELTVRAFTELKGFVNNTSLLSDSTRSFLENIPASGTRAPAFNARINKTYFSHSIFDNYGHQCCITGMGQQVFDQLLIAHHIKPWNKLTESEQIAPDNGLLLNALHAKAFESGLMTIKEDLSIVVSPLVPKTGAYTEHIWRYNGCQLRPPKRSHPGREFIEYHNDVIFKRIDA